MQLNYVSYLCDYVYLVGTANMDKQEYLSNEFLKYLGSMDKEGVMDAITPLIKRLPSYI